MRVCYVLMLEKYRVADPRRSRFDDVHIEATMVLHRSADAVPDLAVDIPGRLFFGFTCAITEHPSGANGRFMYHAARVHVHMPKF